MVEVPVLLRKTSDIQSTIRPGQYRPQSLEQPTPGWPRRAQRTSELLVHSVENTVQKFLRILLLVIAKLWYELPQRIQQGTGRDDGPLATPQYS